MLKRALLNPWDAETDKTRITHHYSETDSAICLKRLQRGSQTTYMFLMGHENLWNYLLLGAEDKLSEYDGIN